ncbi:MAG: hypothetical protein NC321_12740 [Clostridium sp.]|nr:hypothetical protein [Clostridium sp.]
MRGMLYDMIHSVWGMTALIAGGFTVSYCVFYIGLGLYYCWNKCCRERTLRGLRNFLVKNKHVRKEHCIIINIFLGVCILAFVIFIFKDWRVESHKYNYIHTSMAEQKNLNTLFSDETQVRIEEKEYIGKLHIELPIVEITEERISMREAAFAEIYRGGTLQPNLNVKSDLMTEEDMQRIRLAVNEMRSITFEEYQTEYEAWCTLFENIGLPSDLYQSSRAARDMLEVGRLQCDDTELLEIAAEAVYRGEQFLSYENRNINTKDAPVIIEVKDMLFYNGKVFYQLYLETETREELKKYQKDFIVNAYVCMVLAEKMMTEEDIEYAKVNYYIGNIGEKMLNEILRDNSIYIQIANEAKAHYETALSSMEKRVDYYDKESNMEKNCYDGITTLDDLLQ